MKSGDKYFVRIDTKVEGRERDDQILEKHMAWVRELAKKTELYAGGFVDAYLHEKTGLIHLELLLSSSEISLFWNLKSLIAVDSRGKS